MISVPSSSKAEYKIQLLTRPDQDFQNSTPSPESDFGWGNIGNLFEWHVGLFPEHENVVEFQLSVAHNETLYTKFFGAGDRTWFRINR